MEERSSLQAEARSLRERLGGAHDPTAITGKKLLLLQSQMEQMQEENYRSDRPLWLSITEDTRTSGCHLKTGDWA